MPDRSLRLLALPPSPNNIKVRAAMGFLGLPYRQELMDREDRSALVEASGQPLTPVLMDGDLAIFDSGAILRYLHSTTPGSSLFPSEADAMRKVDRWEAMARFGVKDSLGAMYAMFFGRIPTPEGGHAAATRALLAHTEGLEKALADRPYLMGDAPNAVDFTWAGVLAYNVGLDTPNMHYAPFFDTFREHYTVTAEERPMLRDWARRVLRHDSWLQLDQEG